MPNELVNDNVQAEWSVIGSMVIDDRCVPVVLHELQHTDFTDGTCRATFQAIKRLHMQGRPVDPISVLDAMSGGESYRKWLREVMDVTPTAANVGVYIDITRRSAAFYRLREKADKLLLSANLEDAKKLVQEMASLISATSRMPRMTAADLAKDFLTRMQSKEKPEYLPWGLPSADKYTYAELGDFNLLGGYPSSGKTLLSIIMALAQAKRYKVGYYSLETRPEKMADRMFAHLSGVPLDRIKTRKFEQSDWTKFAESTSNFVSHCPFDIIHAAGSTVEDIFSDAVANGYQCIFIDYLQLIKVPEIRSGDRYATVTEISQRVKLSGRRFGISVTALCQLSRPESIKKKGGEDQLVPPNMSSLRESGQLEQDADIIFLLWALNPNDNQSHRQFKLAKNKEGRKFSVELAFMGGTQTMTEIEPHPTSAARQYIEAGRAIKNLNRSKGDGQVSFNELSGEDAENPFDK